MLTMPRDELGRAAEIPPNGCLGRTSAFEIKLTDKPHGGGVVSSDAAPNPSPALTAWLLQMHLPTFECFSDSNGVE